MSHPRRKTATLVFIDYIKPENNSYKLKVQVMKLWKLWRSKKVVSIEMVLVDATGTRIHASIDEDLIQIYEGKVSEGIFKYITKGPDYVRASVQGDDTDDTIDDEIQKFLSCRYISACEATWRILAFPTHYRTTTVVKLSFHLPNQQMAIYNEDDPIDDVLNRSAVLRSKFLAWMEANCKYPEARGLTYAEFPTRFVWVQKTREWKPHDKGVLSPRNEDVDKINECMLSQIKGEERSYLSSDSIDTFDTSKIGDMVYTQEYLNSIKISGLPNHDLKLKIGAPIMLLRNIDPKGGLCNGTRLLVTQLANHVIQAKFITGDKVGQKVLLPRMFVSPP
ncbi:hypothetical protein YC2023_065635 [Brassica napus]